MKAQFQDLCITGLIGERCYPVEGSILRIHLQLSEPPPLGWAYLLSQVWQKVEYPGKRRIGIDSDELWIECAPDEVRTVHLPWLEWALEQTCERFLAQREQKQLAIQNQRELSRQAHMKLEELASSFVPAEHVEETSGKEICDRPESRLGRVVDFLRGAFANPAGRISPERAMA